MSENLIKIKICQNIDSFCSKEINRSEFAKRIKDLFYDTLKQDNLSLDAIEMHYIMTSIIDNEDLESKEFTCEIEHLKDIISGKCHYVHCFATCLKAENSNCDIDELKVIVNKIVARQELNYKEIEWISCFVSKESRSNSSLSELIIERIKTLFRLINVSSSFPSDFGISNMLFVRDEKVSMQDLLSLISDYIDCLSGSRSVFVCVDYHQGGCSIFV